MVPDHHMRDFVAVVATVLLTLGCDDPITGGYPVGVEYDWVSQVAASQHCPILLKIEVKTRVLTQHNTLKAQIADLKNGSTDAVVNSDDLTTVESRTLSVSLEDVFKQELPDKGLVTIRLTRANPGLLGFDVIIDRSSLGNVGSENQFAIPENTVTAAYIGENDAIFVMMQVSWRCQAS